METTSTFSYSLSKPPTVSGSGLYLAYVSGSHLVVKSTVTLATKKLVDLGNEFARSIRIIKWDPTNDATEDRVAVATADTIRTFTVSLGDDSGTATIHAGSRGVAAVEWMSDLENQNTRLAVFSSDLLSVDIWSSDGVDLSILDPKHAHIMPITGSGYAIVARPGTVDVVNCISFTPQGVSKDAAIPLHGVLDAKAISWSCNGKWLAAIDSCVVGYNVQLWAENGLLQRSYKGPYNDIYREAGLGARSMAWLSASRKDFLLIGDCQNQVTVLDVGILQPVALLLHGNVYEKTPVWEEYITKDLVACYKVCIHPWYPTKLKHSNQQKAVVDGIASIHVSPNNRYLATVSSSMPNTAWIWSAGSLGKEFELLSVIGQPSAIVKIEWQPSEGRFLLLMSKGSVVTGIWDSKTQEPMLQEWNAFEGAELLGAEWITYKSEDFFYTKLLAWTSREFSIRDISETPLNGLSIPRIASPQLRNDDDTLVRDLANGVQENEWVQGASLIEDTFQQKLDW